MPRQRKRSPDDDPLFDDAPPKRKRGKRGERGERGEADEAGQSPQCAATNCRLPAAPESSYCNVHTLIFDGIRQLRGSSRKAAARGAFAKGALHGVGSVALDLLGSLFSSASNQVAGAADHAAANAGPVDWSGLFNRAAQQPGQAAPQRSCWEILGLDPETATADDIREVQRKLAAIYHTDKKNPAIAADKIAEINAAALACQQAILTR